jgi:hypothetical protein
MVRALRQLLLGWLLSGLSFWFLDLGLLHWSLQVHGLKLEKCHSFGNTYCMHMHHISIMNA